ncbi:PREDICTED: uncharacterized protein LOC109473527 [Branchiostoma belcheri]|uniref:Uncharacterized protein LOC109473527 n=1 Tax=Branchiostoma belcheri TaxID=7741 RepID=A0A6P4ZH68_BRABE|nr:PREDICTED: uncharacterized protein LOC109473527 [Branchiostoma belcheri]
MDISTESSNITTGVLQPFQPIPDDACSIIPTFQGIFVSSQVANRAPPLFHDIEKFLKVEIANGNQFLHGLNMNFVKQLIDLLRQHAKVFTGNEKIPFLVEGSLNSCDVFNTGPDILCHKDAVAVIPVLTEPRAPATSVITQQGHLNVHPAWTVPKYKWEMALTTMLTAVRSMANVEETLRNFPDLLRSTKYHMALMDLMTISLQGNFIWAKLYSMLKNRLPGARGPGASSDAVVATKMIEYLRAAWVPYSGIIKPENVFPLEHTLGGNVSCIIENFINHIKENPTEDIDLIDMAEKIPTSEPDPKASYYVAMEKLWNDKFTNIDLMTTIATQMQVLKLPVQGYVERSHLPVSHVPPGTKMTIVRA